MELHLLGAAALALLNGGPMLLSRVLPVAGLLLLAACGGTDQKTVTRPMNADGYSLFEVQNDNQQRNAVTVTLENLTPNTSYVLLYTQNQPDNAGWFAIDPDTLKACSTSNVQCSIPGYGDLVDVATVAPNTNTLTLHDDRCGCGGDDDDSEDDWTGHWAVMRVEQAPSPATIRFHVEAVSVHDNWTTTPDITQLQ